MKTCVIQPPYSMDYSRSDELFAFELAALDACDDSLDLIVLPEYSNVPALAATKREMEESYEKYSKPLLERAAATAKRCGAVLFVNCICMAPTGLRNRTVAFDRGGNRVGCYDKQHLVNSEMYVYGLDRDYAYEHAAPTVLEIDGVRYAFLICYDFYFYEAFANIARFDPDVVIACAYQRSDTHRALRIMAQNCAYQTNAYVVRASVSLGADSAVGGCSMIVAPDGEVLLDMKNEVGAGVAEFDPHKRYLKAAGFGNPPATHHAYIEAGRRPWKYRPGGSAIVPYDDVMPYPRMCAHRGFNTVAPENSLPAFGAAVAMGAEEIELDLWQTKDGKVVSIHDSKLDRVSNGTGRIWDYTYEELLAFDFGIKHGEAFEGLRIPLFEEVLAKLACHTVMNVHIKTPTPDPLPEAYLKEIIRQIDLYDCRRHVYFMTGSRAVLGQLRELAPDIARCAGAFKDPFEDLVEKALTYDCRKIQFYLPHVQANDPDYLEDAIRRAHANGIACNMFFADTVEDANRYLDMGIDTILTNDYGRISKTAVGREKYRIDPNERKYQ